jgi:hypothetical protein
MKIGTFLALGAMLALLVSNAQAATFVYGCRYQDVSKLYSAKLDTNKKTLTGRGSVYESLKDVTAEWGVDQCAKQCLQAIRRGGAEATLSLATQGVASLTVTQSWSDKTDEVDCDLVRQ